MVHLVHQANDAGIVIERGSSDNAFIGFDESADKFIVGTGSIYWFINRKLNNIYRNIISQC